MRQALARAILPAVEKLRNAAVYTDPEREFLLNIVDIIKTHAGYIGKACLLMKRMREFDRAPRLILGQLCAA